MLQSRDYWVGPGVEQPHPERKQTTSLTAHHAGTIGRVHCFIIGTTAHLSQV